MKKLIAIYFILRALLFLLNVKSDIQLGFGVLYFGLGMYVLISR